MYVSLLRVLLGISESPVLYLGLITLLLASWGLIVSAIAEIVIKAFDIRV
jgi:hypothetical protein